MDKVYVKAAKAFNTGAHERQWRALVSQLFFEAELWAKECHITTLNVKATSYPFMPQVKRSSTNSENCSIQPDVMRPTRPQGACYVDLETSTISTRPAQTEAAESISRMIDWCLRLEIDMDDKDIILLAWPNLSDYEFSLIQCTPYISNYLLLVDVGIKTSISNCGPLVQHAIWEAGGLLKKRHHRWDASMPMPGITINGHLWECFSLN